MKFFIHDFMNYRGWILYPDIVLSFSALWKKFVFFTSFDFYFITFVLLSAWYADMCEGVW